MQPAKLKTAELVWKFHSATCLSWGYSHTHTQTHIKDSLSAVTAEPRSSDEFSKQSTSIQSCILQVLTLRLPYLHQANE